MEITETMKAEHQNILRVIALVELECDEISQDNIIDKDFFNGLIDFISYYVDKFHHAKEEDILFQWIEKNSANMHCNPVPVMLYEHETGREYLSNMKEALASDDSENLVKYSISYASLLRDHISKEDQVLYPMAEDGINDEQKKSIIEEYKEAEARVRAIYDIDKLRDFAVSKT